MRANRLRSDAETWELRRIADYYDNLEAHIESVETENRDGQILVDDEEFNP
jgi:hypothetical protein